MSIAFIVIRARTRPRPVPATRADPYRDAPKLEGRNRGYFDNDVVGESFYQYELLKIAGGRRAEGHRLPCVAAIVPEPHNPKNKDALQVIIQGLRVGYIPDNELPRFHKALAKLNLTGQPVICNAMIFGGWNRGNGDIGHFGVGLDIKWPMKLAAN